MQEYYKPGKVITYDTYLSTTLSPHYAADRTTNTIDTKADYFNSPEIKGIVYELKTNAGIDATAISRHNAYEREVVLPRDMHFKVVSVETKPAYYDTKGGFDFADDPEDVNEEKFNGIAAVVQMVEVDKDGNEITHTEKHKPIKTVAEIFADKK